MHVILSPSSVDLIDLAGFDRGTWAIAAAAADIAAKGERRATCDPGGCEALPVALLQHHSLFISNHPRSGRPSQSL
jgi:hypothetical protein